jgi:uroporphyrinogen III methyltransferase/synthase
MRVVITRPPQQSAELIQGLTKAGFEVIRFPVIQIEPPDDMGPLDSALRELERFDWVVFTSGNAVANVMERLETLEIQFPDSVKVAAIGPKTAEQLYEFEIKPDSIPEVFVGEALVSSLGDLTGLDLLLPTADIARDTVPEAIRAAGGRPRVVTAYHTRPPEADPEGLAQLRAGADFLTFTSGSTVRNFVDLASGAGLDPLNLPGGPVAACIGPKTAQAARSAGFRVDVVADNYTAAGLVEALETYVRVEAHAR